MPIKLITQNKKAYLDLLLLADEQESMLDLYLERGEMFVWLEETTPIATCVVTDEGYGTFEIKNLAVYPSFQHQGYGRKMVNFILEHYQGRCRRLLVGTGDSLLTVPFYEHCGFTYSHRIANFFLQYYDHPIWEGGKQLVDMLYFQIELDNE